MGCEVVHAVLGRTRACWCQYNSVQKQLSQNSPSVKKCCDDTVALKMFEKALQGKAAKGLFSN